MRLAIVWTALAVLLHAAPRFDITLAPSVGPSSVDGRIILVISKELKDEPRFGVDWGTQTAQIFGIDVDGWKPGVAARIDASVLGHPLRNVAKLAPGTYNVQAVLNVYETFHRADGHVLKMHMDHGEGQHWNTSPGNIFSKPQQVEVGPDSVTSVILTDIIPPIESPKDTRYVRRVQIESKLLSKFWGRPVHLGAIVLVPEGFDENPQQKYPLAFNQGHFPLGYFGFRETPPSADLKGLQRGRANAGYRFFQEWTSGRVPKMLIVLTQHPTPFYDDSYGVNTANMGPYGDALTQELYPYIEKQFRGMGEPWARVLFGGSTGGWMTLAQQIFYPEYFGGAWGFCPDPVDFHAFQLTNLYSPTDKNAFYDIGPFASTPKPLGRMPDDHVLATMEFFSRQEQVLGTHGRSGGQLDAFHATFGPVGSDGYPVPLWNPDTGAIDPAVARYWNEHYDLTAVLSRDWERLGPRLVGKIHVTMGTKDTFYLDAASHRMEQFLESTKLPGKGPYYGGSFEFGDNEPHCFPGKIPPGQTLEMFYLPIFAQHMKKMAPKGADVSSWAQ